MTRSNEWSHARYTHDAVDDVLIALGGGKIAVMRDRMASAALRAQAAHDAAYTRSERAFALGLINAVADAHEQLRREFAPANVG